MDRVKQVQLSRAQSKERTFARVRMLDLSLTARADHVDSEVDVPGRGKRQGVLREDSYARGQCPTT